ncbi:MAG: dTDP-4-dehydrorhamnose reductase [Hyphomonas sp.]|uniref:dTDP-4-dehydrorhamnose reductase n=1 Tax=Hyphomonas sp. TaxID=87 RepID=UPI003526D062
MADTRILVVGGAGQVARALTEAEAPEGIHVIARGRPQLDILDAACIDAALDDVSPRLVVNAAAYTAVDQAESDQAACTALNVDAPGALAAATARRGIPIIHLSTDYVFDGSKEGPYVETDLVAPLGVYGRSKLVGEGRVAAANPAHVILRTAWVYSPFGKNFVKTMLRVGAGRDELGVVHDQRGNPTSAADIADGILTVATRLLSGDPAAPAGIYHMTAGGEASWAEFAEHIFACSAEVGGPVARVKRITTAEYPTPVKRPANSRLACGQLKQTFGVALPDWRDSTRTCVNRLFKTREWEA